MIKGGLIAAQYISNTRLLLIDLDNSVQCTYERNLFGLRLPGVRVVNVKDPAFDGINGTAVSDR